MAPYSQHVVIATARTDWASRIEHDGGNRNWGALTRRLKGMMTRGGKYADVSEGILSGLIVYLETDGVQLYEKG
jgi:hypothetical protein